MDGFYFEPEIEKMSREDLKTLQLDLLKKTLTQAL